jgi:YspA, cpYpsA-related SLOG family
VKLAVIGSRWAATETHYQQLVRELDALAESQPITLIISGGAAGPDALSERYGREWGVPTQVFRPDYQSYGRAAPLVRNELIIQQAEACFALWDGVSKGTGHALRLARKRGLKLIVVVPLP